MLQVPDRACPLCRSQTTTPIQVLEAGWLIEEWQRQYELDLTNEEVATVSRIEQLHCAPCDFDFFSPPCPATGAVYEKLQEYDWYYEPSKWEFDEADSFIGPDDRVLEMGCGRGHYLERLAKRGIEAVGIELNEDAQAHAGAKGLRVVSDAAALSEEEFDIVCSFQVLEHVDDPRGFLSQGRDLLASGGLLLACVPNGASFIRHDRDNLLNMPPHHVSRWTPQAFRRAAEFLGCELVALTVPPLTSPVIDWFVSTQISRLSRRGRLVEMIGWRVCAPIMRWALRIPAVRARIPGHDLFAVLRKN